MIERFQESNKAGDRVYQAPGGYCPNCNWSNDPADSGNFAFLDIAGKTFTLRPTVIGFESQTRELTISEATTVDFSLVPLPVKIRMNVIDSS